MLADEFVKCRVKLFRRCAASVDEPGAKRRSADDMRDSLKFREEGEVVHRMNFLTRAKKGWVG